MEGVTVDGDPEATTANSSWNMSVEDLLGAQLGPRSRDTVSAVVLTIVYSLIFLSGSMGNICTCIVIVRNHCMQTTTNYYLFSLAVSDILLLFFGLPPELFSIWEAYPWRFGEAFCYLRPTILEFTSYASVLTITAFTVERYIAVCRPLLSHKLAVLSRAVKIIICIWIVALLAALPYAAHTRLYYAVTWPPTGQPVRDSLVCSIPDKWLEGRMTYMFQISTFLFFLAPVTLIICLYILIGVVVRRSPLSRGSSDDQSNIHVQHTPLPQQPRRVVIRMLVAVTVAFIICWAPFHTQRLMVLYVHSWTPQLLAAQSHIFYFSGVMYFVSSIVNPILYNVISRRYRVAFKQTIFGPCSKIKGPRGSRQGLSNNFHSRHYHQGDSAYYPQQQRNSLVGRECLPNSGKSLSLKLHGGSVRGQGVAGGKPVSVKVESKVPSPRSMEHMASTLCPAILGLGKAAKLGKGVAIEDEVRRGSSQGEFASKHRTSSSAKKAGGHSSCSNGNTITTTSTLATATIATEGCVAKYSVSSPRVENGYMQMAPTCTKLSSKDLESTSLLKNNRACDDNHREENSVSALLISSDAKNNSKDDVSTKCNEALLQNIPSSTSAHSCLRGCPSEPFAPSASLHSTAVPTRLSCKRCLASTPVNKGQSTYNGVHAYHAGFEVNKSLTLV